eukprot:m.101202 g.101202  ORF g.101202 m.101202 type:complete len:72 (-) comp15161_c0_seq3:1285-1500(-)
MLPVTPVIWTNDGCAVSIALVPDLAISTNLSKSKQGHAKLAIPAYLPLQIKASMQVNDGLLRCFELLLCLY